jgi:hypothetical protein
LYSCRADANKVQRCRCRGEEDAEVQIWRCRGQRPEARGADMEVQSRNRTSAEVVQRWYRAGGAGGAGAVKEVRSRGAEVVQWCY